MSLKQHQASDEISIVGVLNLLSLIIKELKSKLWVVLLVCAIGSGIGYLIAKSRHTFYIAKSTFVIEDAKSGGNMNGLLSIAGQLGVDVGGSTGGGLMTSENILLYFKSEALIKDVMLTLIDSNAAFIDKYIEIYEIKNKIEGSDKPIIYKYVKEKKAELTRTQDSLLKVVLKRIHSKELSINRIDKKSGFFQLSISMRDEMLSKFFCEQLLGVALKNYTNLKTERQLKTIRNLQHRADSISAILLNKTYLSSNLANNSQIEDINPLFRARTIATTESVVRDKSILGAMFAEVVKNLEMAKLNLSQETPVIQVVDKPSFPLEIEKSSTVKSMVVGAVLAFFLTSFFFFANILKKRSN